MAPQIPGVNRLVGTFVNPVVNSLDVDGLIQHIDLDDVINRVDIQRVVDRIDFDAVVDKVDINRLLGRVDVTELLNRIDFDQVAQRIDVNAMAQRVDLDRLLENVDVERLIERARVANVVGDTAGAMALSALDLARQQLVTIDTLICYAAIRAVRRIRVRGADPDGRVAGRPAGPFTRLVADIIDSIAVAAMFSLGVILFSYLAGLFTHHVYHPQHEGFWWAVGLAAAVLPYMWAAVAIWGQTLGKAIVGLRVIHYGGGPVRGWSALVRALVFPFSCILGLGLIEIVFGRERRGFHDHVAHTQVIYDWGGRQAHLSRGITTWLMSQPEVGPSSGSAIASERAA